MKYRWISAMCSIGIAGYMLADTIHEVIGHGGACLLIGNKIDLISSVYFKSRPGSFLTDIGGPIANLVFGVSIYYFLEKRKSTSLFVYLFLLHVMAYNLFWFSGTIFESGFSKTGDWTYAVKALHIEAVARPVLIIAGILAYLIFIKILKLHVDRIGLVFAGSPVRQSVICAYFAAAIAATIAGLFFEGDRTHAALEGLLEVLGLLPILFIIPGRQTKVNSYQPGAGPILAISIFLLFIAYCFTLGSGIFL